MRVACALCICFGVFLIPGVLKAESKNPSDYPIRVHVVVRSETTFYRQRNADEAKGDGIGNLFSESNVQGFDFSFDCSQRLQSSLGYETYPAKWKKPNQELTVLLPVFGKANSYFTCNLKTDLKDFAYYTSNHTTQSEPATQFKQWMVKHDYDPVHGKKTPVQPSTGSVAPSGN